MVLKWDEDKKAASPISKFIQARSCLCLPDGLIDPNIPVPQADSYQRNPGIDWQTPENFLSSGGIRLQIKSWVSGYLDFLAVHAD